MNGEEVIRERLYELEKVANRKTHCEEKTEHG